MAGMGIERNEEIEIFIWELRHRWIRNPHLRFGQLVANLMQPSEPCPELFYIEDGEFYKKMKSMLDG